MSTVIDLSMLPAPTIIEALDYETLLTTRRADLVARYPAAADVITLESEPLNKLLEESAYRELILRQRINDAARGVMLAFRMMVLVMVYFGSVNSVPLVWDMADLSMGIMALINLIAILILSPLVFLLLKDYSTKLKLGKEPEFKLSEHPGLKRRVKSDIW